MKDLPKNFAHFLLSLDMKRVPKKEGLACPAYHVDRQTHRRARAWSEAASTGQLETPAEFEVAMFSWRSPAERARPSRGAPGTKEV